MEGVIAKLPENSKAKGILTTALYFAKMSENLAKKGLPTEWNKELDNFLWVSSKDIPWCKAFTNAVLDKNWVAHTPWNYSRSALSLPNRIDQNDGKKFQPGDLVIVWRSWSATDWAPGWHIWIFVWMSPNWHPIIVWWNQSHRVTVKEERRPILWIRRVISNEEAKKDKEYMEWKN